MNNKILVIVYSPNVDEEYDIFIPINKKVETVKNIIVNSINYFANSANHILINQEDNKIKKFAYDDWFKDNFNPKNGIYIGNGLDD